MPRSLSFGKNRIVFPISLIISNNTHVAFESSLALTTGTVCNWSPFLARLLGRLKTDVEEPPFRTGVDRRGNGCLHRGTEMSLHSSHRERNASGSTKHMSPRC